MPVRKDPEVAQWVQFGTDGSLPIRELNGKSDYGSSFASAQIAGILASIDAANPIKDASDARSRLNEFTQDKSYSLRSEEHTSELQSLMRISYAVFCLKKKNKTRKIQSK